MPELRIHDRVQLMRHSTLAPPTKMDADGWPLGRPLDVFVMLMSSGMNTSGGSTQGSPSAPQQAQSEPPDMLESGAPN